MNFMYHHQSLPLSQCKRAMGAAASLMHYGCMISSQTASSSSVSYCTRYVRESERVFHSERNGKTVCVSYGGLQSAYIKNCGLVVESYQMVEQNHSFFPWDDLLREYAKKMRVIEARRLFNIMPNRSTVSWHAMIQGYIKIGYMREARALFESSPKTGLVWESMISGYARHRMSKSAIEIFNRNLQNNMFTSQMLIAGYFIADNFTGGDYQWEAICVPRDTNSATWNLLIEGNTYLGLKSEVDSIFNDMEKNNVNKNVMSWNCMIAMLKRCQSREGETIKYFMKMPTALRNSHSWNLTMALPVTRGGISDEQMVEKVASVFFHMPEKQQNPASWNTLIYVYLKTGMLEKAQSCFDSMPEKNPHSWGLMIAGYLQNGMFDEAKKIFFDNSIRVYDDLHSLILFLVWFVKKKKMMDDAKQFIIDNVPKRPLSFYSIARSCTKHGLVQESKLVLETMQSTMGINLDIHQTTTFMEEMLKEKRGPIRGVDHAQRFMASRIETLEDTGDLSDPFYLQYASQVKEQSRPMFKYEIHSRSGIFMQILDSQIDADGDFSEMFLKGAWDCCGIVQV